MSNIFLISWDCEGIEACLNVTDYEKEVVWANLSGQDPPARLSSVVRHLMLRARANPQRHYEIYTMNVEEGISENDVFEMFENDPQGSADLIRDRGNKIFSDRLDVARAKIV